MGVQWHPRYPVPVPLKQRHPRWLENIVIPHHQAKSLQATNSYFIFNLMGLAHQLDSNWNTMQQVRILVTLCLEQRNRTYKLEFFKAWLVTYFDLPHLQLRNSKALQIRAQLAFLRECGFHNIVFKEPKKCATQDLAVPITYSLDQT